MSAAVLRLNGIKQSAPAQSMECVKGLTHLATDLAKQRLQSVEPRAGSCCPWGALCSCTYERRERKTVSGLREICCSGGCYGCRSEQEVLVYKGVSSAGLAKADLLLSAHWTCGAGWLLTSDKRHTQHSTLTAAAPLLTKGQRQAHL